MRSKIIYVALFFLTLLVFACKPDGKTKDYSMYQIAYNVLLDNDSGNYEVFVMDIDGTNKRNLSKSPSVDWAYHAHNGEVYYISDRETSAGSFLLYAQHVDSINPRRISFVRMADSWLDTRNDGSEIIIKPHSMVDSVFYIIDQKGALVQKVDVGLPYLNDPMFVNDGKAIVFRGSETAVKMDSVYVDELYYFDLENESLKQLTHYPESDSTAQWYHYHAGPPQWNPSRQMISYSSMQNASYSIFSVDLDGQSLAQITPDGFSQGWHDWSEDGELLIYDGTPVGDKENHDIYIQYPEADTSIRLTFDSWYQQAPLFVKSQTDE